jgi:hypothetical protein
LCDESSSNLNSLFLKDLFFCFPLIYV